MIAVTNPVRTLPWLVIAAAIHPYKMDVFDPDAESYDASQWESIMCCKIL